jgi:amino acid transporter
MSEQGSSHPAGPVAEFEAADRGLHKTMSLQQLLFLSLGAIIGSGWLFAVLGADAVAGPASVISWVVGGVFVLLIALAYAEISGMIPRSGAIVRYAGLTHGAYTGFILGWAYLLSAVSVPAIEAEAVVTYLSTKFAGADLTTTVSGVKVLTWPNGILAAIGLMILFFVVNYFGIRFLSEFNRWITWWKLIIPTLTFILLFFAFKGQNFTAYGGFAPLGASPILQALATSGIVFAYLGFRQALDYGGEARNPQRDVPLATILSVVIAVVIYVLLQLAFTGALNFSNAGIASGAWAKLEGSGWASGPLYSAMNATGIGLLGAFATVLLIDAAISPSGTGWIYMGTSARTVYGLSVTRYLPKVFQRMSRFGIPAPALIAGAVVGAFFFVPLPSWYSLVGFITSATVLTYIMGGIGLPVMRRAAPSLPRPFRLPWAELIAPLSFLAALLIVYWSGFTTLVNVFAAVFIGLAVFAWYYAPNVGWISRQVGALLGIVFAIVWVVVNLLGGWVLNTSSTAAAGSLSFPAYYVLFAGTLVVFSVILWALSNEDGRKHIERSAWLLFLLLGTFLVSYIGEYGPLSKPILRFPVSDLMEIVLGLVSYYWAVASGFVTEELRAIVGQPIEETGEPGKPRPTAQQLGGRPVH